MENLVGRNGMYAGLELMGEFGVLEDVLEKQEETRETVNNLNSPFPNPRPILVTPTCFILQSLTSSLSIHRSLLVLRNGVASQDKSIRAVHMFTDKKHITSDEFSESLATGFAKQTAQAKTPQHARLGQ